MVEGLERNHTFEGVGRTAPEDYLRNGQMVQSKFYNGSENTLDAVRTHLDKYPDFVKKVALTIFRKNSMMRLFEC